MAAQAEGLPGPATPIPAVDLSLQVLSGQTLPDGVVTAPAAACHHARLIDGGLAQLLERKEHLSKGFLVNYLGLEDAPSSREDKEFLSKALLSYLDVVQQLEDAQDTQDVLRARLTVASCHAAAEAHVGSLDTLRHVVSLLRQLEDPSSQVEVAKVLDAFPEVQPVEELETSLQALPEMALVYRELVQGSEARWRAQAEAIEELGRCWKLHHNLSHGAATKKSVTLVSAAPAAGPPVARGMPGMPGMGGGMPGMPGMGGMAAPQPTSKEELVDVEVDADLDLIRVIETATIARDLVAARDVIATSEADDGGALSMLLYQDLNDDRGLELLVYLRLVRMLAEYLQGDHEHGTEPLVELAKLLHTGEYAPGKRSKLSPAALQSVAQEALREVIRAFRHVLPSPELVKAVFTPLGILVTDPEAFLEDFPASQAKANADKQAGEQAAQPAPAPTPAPAAPAPAATPAPPAPTPPAEQSAPAPAQPAPATSAGETAKESGTAAKESATSPSPAAAGTGADAGADVTESGPAATESGSASTEAGPATADSSLAAAAPTTASVEPGVTSDDAAAAISEDSSAAAAAPAAAGPESGAAAAEPGEAALDSGAAATEPATAETGPDAAATDFGAAANDSGAEGSSPAAAGFDAEGGDDTEDAENNPGADEFDAAFAEEAENNPAAVPEGTESGEAVEGAAGADQGSNEAEKGVEGADQGSQRAEPGGESNAGSALDAITAAVEEANKAEAEGRPDGERAETSARISEAIAAAIDAPQVLAGSPGDTSEVLEAAVREQSGQEEAVVEGGQAEEGKEEGNKEAENEQGQDEDSAGANAEGSASNFWSMEDLLSGSVLVDLELELRQHHQAPDAPAWKLVLGLRAAALQLQHSLQQQPLSIDGLALAQTAQKADEYAVARGLLLLDSVKSFAAEAAADAGRLSEASALMLEFLANLPHERLGWRSSSSDEGEIDSRVQRLQGVYDELQGLMAKLPQVECWALTGAHLAQLGQLLGTFLGDAPLYVLPEGVYNPMAAQVASLFMVQEAQCPQLAYLELWQLLKGIVTSDNPLQSALRGYLLAVLALDDPDERTDALKELWGSMEEGENYDVDHPAYPDDSPVKAFDPLDAALQLISSTSMALSAMKELPPVLQTLDNLVMALRRVQKAVLQIQPLFQTEEEHRLMEEAATEADMDRERTASLVTDKAEFAQEVTEKVFALLHDPSSHPNPAERLKALLDMGANMQEEEEGFTPLHLAVACGERTLLPVLLQYPGVEVNKRSLPLTPDISTLDEDKALLSPLDLASLLGNWQAAEVLIRHGASTSADPETGLCPLHYAVSAPAQTLTPALAENKRITVALLLKHRAPVNAAALDSGMTPLLLAVSHRLMPLVQALLKGRANVNKTDKLGLSALHHLVMGPREPQAAVEESRRLLRLLLASGAKTDQGPYLDDPCLAAFDMAPYHWELPRSIQVLRSFGAPDAVLASVAAAPTSSLAALLYSSVVQRVARVASSRVSRHTRDVWWHDRDAAKNFRKRMRLAVANGFHVRLTPYRLALLNEKWGLVDILKKATPGASQVQAPLSGGTADDKLQVAVGDSLREATLLENKHGYQYLLTHESDNQARTNRRLQLAGLAPWVRRQGYLVLQPKIVDWSSEAFEWSQCSDADMKFQMEMADKHGYKVGYVKRKQYSTVGSNMVRVLDLSKVPDTAADIKSCAHALLQVLPAFGDNSF